MSEGLAPGCSDVLRCLRDATFIIKPPHVEEAFSFTMVESQEKKKRADKKDLKKEKRKVLNELLETERSYVRDLELILSVCCAEPLLSCLTLKGVS